MSKLQSFFQGQHILITGASSGIGRDLAQVLAQWGAHLALVARKTEGLSEFAHQNKILLYKADVCDKERMREIQQDLQSKWGHIDLVVANAGVGGLNPGDEFSSDIDQQIMCTNYFGTVNTLIPFVSQMITQKSGHLVGISSLAGLRGLPNAASYSSSKAAQATLLEALRLDLKRHGIKVSSLHPGFVETPMTDHDEFDMPFKISVRESTYHILRAIWKNKGSYYYPWPMAILSHINRFLPCWLYDLLIPFLSKAYEKKKLAKIF